MASRLFLGLFMVCVVGLQGVCAWPLVRSGASGPDVVAVQSLLQAHGHSLSSDGLFGPITEAAVKSFQIAKGLTADGIVGPLTWPKLIITVQSGSSGKAVHAVQYLLVYKYNLLVAADNNGVFGPTTVTAVISFQASHSLAQDGIVGPLTWDALVSGAAMTTGVSPFHCKVVLPTPTVYTGDCSEEVTLPQAPASGVASSSCTPQVTISECQLRTIMGGVCPQCRYYYPYIIKAMERFHLNCPDRIAAFLATVRHETAGLQTLFQPLDCGAGGVHMIPINFPSFLSGDGMLPDLATQFQQNEIPATSIGLGESCEGRTACASTIVQLPENAFVTAGWWFTTGSRKSLGGLGCYDLRQDADVGLGTQSPPTGFYKISRCVFGANLDAGLQQRVLYYNNALAVTNLLKQ